MKNKSAKAIEVLGWIYIIGGSFITLIVAGEASTFSGYETGSGDGVGLILLIGIFSSVAGGLLILGFAEVIHLLQKEVNRSENIEMLLNDIYYTNIMSHQTTKSTDEMTSGL